VWIDVAKVREIVSGCTTTPAQQYDYLVDVTAVEYRDAVQPLEMVWHLRSLPYRRFLRLKAELDGAADLVVPSIEPVYKSANWLERECFDMFGITFTGHSDLRRILMWESYAEGYPAAKGLSVARALQPCRAAVAGAVGQSGGAVLDGRTERRGRLPRTAGRHARAPRCVSAGRATMATTTRTVEVELATQGMDAQR
jgi:hypothetical protein